jgi:phosphatidylinositol kinase/protein kinase (PI-3  family)
MSEEQKEKKPTWLAKEFPTEWYFTEKFEDKLFHILDKVPDDTLLNFIEMPKIFGKSTKGYESDGNSAANVEVNPNFTALFGIMASTISETMSEVLKESQISSSTKYGELLSRMVKQKLALDHPTVETSDHKKCNSCGTENRGMARYCDNCGLSFQG